MEHDDAVKEAVGRIVSEASDRVSSQLKEEISKLSRDVHEIKVAQDSTQIHNVLVSTLASLVSKDTAMSPRDIVKTAFHFADLVLEESKKRSGGSHKG